MLAMLTFFFAKKNSFFLLYNNNQKQVTNNAALLVKKATLGVLVFKLKYSFLTHGCFLLDICGYELQQNTQKRGVICHLWSTGVTRLLTLTPSKQKQIPSAEILFFNAKWLEREIAEMSGWFFFNKRDRRVMFLIPVVFTAPLLKTYPVGGFFDLMLCTLTNKLSFKHQTWLS